MRRLLPDFYRPQTEHPAGSAAAESLNSALRGLHEPDIIDAKRRCGANVSWTRFRRWRQVRDHRGRRALLGCAPSTTCGWPWAPCSRSVRKAPTGCRAEHPMAGHLDVYQWLTVLQEYLVLGADGPKYVTRLHHRRGGHPASATTTGSIRRRDPWARAGPAAPPSS